MMATERKQQQIPGTELPSIPELEEKAEDYRALRDNRMALADKEAEAKRALLAELKSRNLTKHVYEDSDGVRRKIEIENKDNIKVRKVPDDKPEPGATVGDGGDTTH